MKDFFIGLSSLASPHLFIVFFTIILILFVIFYTGLHFEFKGNVIDIGGIRQRNKNKEFDDDIRVVLHKIMADIDRFLYADIITITEDVDIDLLKVYKGTCPFTVARYNAVIKQELYRRINYNDLKMKLSINQKDAYIKSIKNNIRDKYLYFQNLSEETECEDIYPVWEKISDDINGVIDTWIERVTARYVARLNEKIKEYKRVSKQFKIKKLKQKYCLVKVDENAESIRNLGGEVEQ